MTKGAWKPAFLAAAVLAMAPSGAQARPGDLDPTFSADGIGQYQVAQRAGTGPIPADAFPTASLTPAGFEPGGDVILGGLTRYAWNCLHVGCEYRTHLGLARVTPSGELDAGFGDGGVVETDLGFQSSSNFGAIWGPVDTAVGGDGRIVAAFGVQEGYQSPQPRVARFLDDGSLDPSFSGDGISAPLAAGGSPEIDAVAIQDDGRIVLVGRVDAHNYNPFTVDADLLIARLLPNGDPDPAFGGGDGAQTYNFGPDDRFADVALDNLGRIVVAGTASHAATLGDTAFTVDVAVARLQPDGAPDPGFSDDGRALVDLIPDRASNAVFGALTLAGNRPVVLAAAHPDEVGQQANFTVLVRLDGGGDLDASFGSGGLARLEQIADLQGPVNYAVAAQPDGSVLVGGGEIRSLLLGRRLPTGQPDPAFGQAGWLRDYPPAGFWPMQAGLIAAGDRALLGGATADNTGRAQLARFRLDPAPPDDQDADGVLDPADRCPGVYVREAGCPPPFSIQVNLHRWQHGLIGGDISGDTVNCAPLKIGIFRKRHGPDRRIGEADRLHMGLPTDEPLATPFEGGWSVPREGALARGGRLYVRAAPRFDPTVGDCEGDRSTPVRVPPRR